MCVNTSLTTMSHLERVTDHLQAMDAKSPAPPSTFSKQISFSFLYEQVKDLRANYSIRATQGKTSDGFYEEKTLEPSHLVCKSETNILQ